MVARATADSSFSALITDAIAAMAPPPQIAVPQEVRIPLQVGHSDQIEQAVHDGQLDVGLIERPCHLKSFECRYWRYKPNWSMVGCCADVFGFRQLSVLISPDRLAALD